MVSCVKPLSLLEWRYLLTTSLFKCLKLCTLAPSQSFYFHLRFPSAILSLHHFLPSSLRQNFSTSGDSIKFFSVLTPSSLLSCHTSDLDLFLPQWTKNLLMVMFISWKSLTFCLGFHF